MTTFVIETRWTLSVSSIKLSYDIFSCFGMHRCLQLDLSVKRILNIYTAFVKLFCLFKGYSILCSGTYVCQGGRYSVFHLKLCRDLIREYRHGSQPKLQSNISKVTSHTNPLVSRVHFILSSSFSNLSLMFEPSTSSSKQFTYNFRSSKEINRKLNIASMKNISHNWSVNIFTHHGPNRERHKIW